MSCPTLEQWAAWVIGEDEPGGTDALEAHLFECDLCAGNAERLRALVGQLRALLPPVLTPERRRRLEQQARSAPLPMVAVSPGEQGRIVLGAGREIGFWLMHADLGGVEQLDCELLALDGTSLVSFADVPFDAERGEVVLCCQVHYRTLGFPDDMRVRVTAIEATGRRELAEFRLNHSFDLP